MSSCESVNCAAIALVDKDFHKVSPKEVSCHYLDTQGISLFYEFVS